MPARSAEREQFLADVLTTAIEGGIGYWSQCTQYQWVDDEQVRVVVGKRQGDTAHATIHVLKDDESGYEDEGHDLTPDVIAKGFGILRKLVADRTNFNGHPALSTPDGRDAYLSVSHRTHLMGAYTECEAGDIDSDDADNIVQLALFGKIVYG